MYLRIRNTIGLIQTVFIYLLHAVRNEAIIASPLTELIGTSRALLNNINMQLKSSETLLNVRLCYSSLVVGHLLFAAIVLLPIDMSRDEDPKISAYARIKWKLLTTWFNILMLAYFPVSIYCDWKQKKEEWNNKQVLILRRVKDTVMTSILFPTVMYSDYFFWRMWYQDPSLIAPLGIFEYLPSWGQHSLHTASGFTVLLDILLTPRRRPDSILPGAMLMFAFCCIYSLVITVSYYNGQVVYSVIEIFNKHQVVLLISLAFIEHVFFYTLQWCIIDLVHGKQVQNTKKCS